MKVLVPGQGTGTALVLDAAISLWGGVDQISGRILDPTHPQQGEALAGRIVYIPRGRGSSSSSSVLAELLRIGNGPAGIVLGEADSILVVGALVAGHLYGANCPVLEGPFPGQTGEIWEISNGRLRPGDEAE